MGARIRPTWERLVASDEATVAQAVSRRLKAKDCPISGLVAQRRIELHVHGNEQHLWSPQLIVDVEAQDDTALLLKGRFGPHPSVWTMYVAAYAACAFIAFLGFSFGVAQYVMQQPPWAFVGVLVGVLLAAGLLSVALLGQGLSQTEMERLRSFVDECLDALPASQPTAQPSAEDSQTVLVSKDKAGHESVA